MGAFGSPSLTPPPPRARWCPARARCRSTGVPPICGGPLLHAQQALLRPCARAARRRAGSSPCRRRPPTASPSGERRPGAARCGGRAAWRWALATASWAMRSRFDADQRRQLARGARSPPARPRCPPDSRRTSVCSAGTSPGSMACGRSTQTARRASSRLSSTTLLGGVEVAGASVWRRPGRSSSASSRHSSCTEVATNAWARVSWMSRAMRVRSAITACSARPRPARGAAGAPASNESPAASAAGHEQQERRRAVKRRAQR